MTITIMDTRRSHGLSLLYINIYCHYLICVLEGSSTVSSSVRVNFEGKDIGPTVELSSTVLTDREKLSWTCREGDPLFEHPKLQRKISGDWLEFQAGQRKDRRCSGVDDPEFMCSVQTGEVQWSKELGGIYRCNFRPSETYNILWIDPTVIVSDKNVGNDMYGDTVSLPCSVDITPTDINYANIATVTWHMRNERLANTMTPVIPGGRYKMVTPPTGTGFQLEISQFSGLFDGGVYRCSVAVKGYRPGIIQSKEFSVTGKVKAILTNSLRIGDFRFGIGENPEFRCTVDAYPKVDDIQVTLNGVDVSGYSSYKEDTLDTTGVKHYAVFTIFNISETHNNSILQCNAVRNNVKENSDSVTLLVFEDAPPLSVVVDPNGETVHTSGTKEPWIIAVAVIIPLLVVLVIVVLCIWCRRKSRDQGGYSVGNTDDR